MSIAKSIYFMENSTIENSKMYIRKQGKEDSIQTVTIGKDKFLVLKYNRVIILCLTSSVLIAGNVDLLDVKRYSGMLKCGGRP